MRSFVADDDLLRIECIFPPHEFEHYQPSARARDLLDGAHPKVSVEILPPTALSFRQSLALPERLLVCVIVAAHDARRPTFEMGLKVKRFETAVMYVLELSEWVLDNLGCQRRGNASK